MFKIIKYFCSGCFFICITGCQAEAKNNSVASLNEIIAFMADHGTKSINDVVTDGQGNTYVVGGSRSMSSPLVGAVSGVPSADNKMDAFFAKYSNNGSQLEFIVNIGGSNSDFASSVVLSPNGDIVVSGTTYSSDFPVQGDIQSKYGSRSDGFVTVFDSDGVVKASRYIGGFWPDVLSDVFVSLDGSIYVGGWTESLDFPTGSGESINIQGRSDGFVLKLDPVSLEIVSANIFGGKLADQVVGIYVDTEGSVYVAGSTSSALFAGQLAPVHEGSSPSSMDIFLMKLGKTDLKVEYVSMLGGSQSDFVHSLSSDGNGVIYIAGESFSDDFPLIPLQAINLNGRKDGFVIKASAASGAPLASILIGGSASDSISDISVDSSGRLSIVGSTGSMDFPGTSAGSYNGGARDAFYSRLDPNTLKGIAAQYLGGGQYDDANAIAVTEECDVFIAGRTGSSGFSIGNKAPVLNPGGGTIDGFLLYSSTVSCM